MSRDRGEVVRRSGVQPKRKCSTFLHFLNFPPKVCTQCAATISPPHKMKELPVESLEEIVDPDAPYCMGIDEAGRGPVLGISLLQSVL